MYTVNSMWQIKFCFLEFLEFFPPKHFPSVIGSVLRCGTCGDGGLTVRPPSVPFLALGLCASV